VKTLKILLYIVGFPLLLGLVGYQSFKVIENGITYLPFSLVGVTLAIVIGLAYMTTAIVTGKKAKSGDISQIRKGTAAMMLVGFCLTAGLWFIIDKVVPPVLDDATSGTILFKDLQEDYKNDADFHREMLDKFITLNYENGNLSAEKSLEDYLSEGYYNADVKHLIAVNSKSIDEGYNTFVGPWLDMANDKRMTIPAIVHLVVNQREKDVLPFIFAGEGREEDPEAPIDWTIMDMLGEPMPIALPGSIGGILGLIPKELMNDVFQQISEVVKNEKVAGSYIYFDITIDEDTGATSFEIVPTNASRGVLDYMHQQWLGSNNLLFAIISLFPLRALFLIFGGVLALASFCIGLIREKQYGKTEAPEAKAPAGNSPDDPTLSPYLKSYISSFNELTSRRGFD
jgi:hypothetical protein